MNPDDFFKHFFGHRGDRRPPSFGDDRKHDDFMGDFDDVQPGDHGNHPRENEDPFDDFHTIHIPEPSDMFRHFEEMFRNFGMTEFPRVGPRGFHGEDGGSVELPRDRMLKIPDSQLPAGDQDSHTHSSPPEHKDQQPRPPVKDDPFDFSAWVDKFASIPNGTESRRPDQRQDIDLDKEVQKDGGNLDKVFSDSREQPRDVMPRADTQPRSFFRSTSVVTVRGPDGKTEQKKITRDGTGKEETTVTRSLGDQSHSVTTTSDELGVKERIESFDNIDEKDLGVFEQRWSSSDHSSAAGPDSMLKVPSLPYQDNNNQKGFLRRLFEYSFPGFSSPDK